MTTMTTQTESMNDSGFGEDVRLASVDHLFLDLFPELGERSSRQAAAIRELLGLTAGGENRDVQPVARPAAGSSYGGMAEGLDGWPTHGVVAAGVGVPRRQVSRWLAEARRRWSRRPSLLALGADIRALLERRGVMTAEALGDAVLGLRGGGCRPEEQRRRARAVVRAAVEAEQAFPVPQFCAYRRFGGVFVALAHGGGPSPAACVAALRAAQTPAVAGEVDLVAAVNEIVDAVLDAADHEILEDIGVAVAGVAAHGLELLQALTLDVLRRYRERQRREVHG